MRLALYIVNFHLWVNQIDNNSFVTPAAIATIHKTNEQTNHPFDNDNDNDDVKLKCLNRSHFTVPYQWFLFAFVCVYASALLMH